MLKIAALGLAGLLVVCLSAGLTWAFINDTETSSDNTLSAGTLDLQVGDNDPCSENLLLDDIKPGDQGNAASWAVVNKGTLEGSLFITVGQVENIENTYSEVEIACGDDTSFAGELGNFLLAAFWMDRENDGWNSGDYYLDPSGSGLLPVLWSVGTDLPEQAYFPLDAFGGKSSEALQDIAGGDSGGWFKVDYSFPENGIEDNQAQSDSSVFDITFVLVQNDD